MARVFKPPEPLPAGEQVPTVFLAGSIEMGRAEPWQQFVEQALAASDCLILNPRRDYWDSTWVQSIEHDRFREQVEWELEGQERADVIAMYFDPATRSPVTLLEVGLFARTGKLVVCCPPGFWRKGNVDIVCRRYAIPMCATLDELAGAILERLQGRMS